MTVFENSFVITDHAEIYLFKGIFGVADGRKVAKSKSANFAISRNTNIDCILIYNS